MYIVISISVCQTQSRTHIYAASFGTKDMWGYFMDSSYMLEKVRDIILFFFEQLVRDTIQSVIYD